MIKYYLKSYWKTIKKILLEGFALIGGFYTALEILKIIFPLQYNLLEFLFKVSIILSILIATIYNFPKRRFSHQIKIKDVKITLVIGNLFKQNGAKVIPTNSTFDTKLDGEFISNKSIQGQYQFMYYKDTVKTLDNLMEIELKKASNYEILDRVNSKNKRYPIGTVIKLNTHDDRFYFLATADVNTDGKPTSNFQNIQISLESLWNYILEKGHMEPIVIPIIGTGRTGLSVKRQKIVKEIIFSFIAHTTEKKISDELVICIHPDDLNHIDLTELNEYLDYICKYYYDNTDNSLISGTAVEENIKIS